MGMYLEIPVLLLFFALMLSDSVTTNLIIFRTCYITLGYNKTECALLGSGSSSNATSNLEKLVEPYATVISMTVSLIGGVCTSIACLFVGPWSDKFGRKPILMVSTTGLTWNYTLYLAWASFDELSPWYTIICTVPLWLTGGIPSFITVALGYVADITDENNRGMRMGIFDGFLFLGGFLGTLSSSYVFARTNYMSVYFYSTSFCMFSFVLIKVYVRESLENAQTQGRFRGLFQVDNIKSMLKTTTKPRPNFQRFCIFGSVLMMSLYIFMFNGHGSLTFMYLRENFHWSLQKYTQYSAVGSMVVICGTVFGIYFLHKVLKIPETVLILVSFLSSMNGSLLMGLAKTDWVIYAVPVVKLLGGVAGPMIRSLISKIVDKEEVGKVLALLTSSEFIIGMAGAPVYTLIYNKTIETNPAVFNFVNAGINALEVLIISVVILVRTKQRDCDNDAVAAETADDLHLLDEDDEDVDEGS